MILYMNCMLETHFTGLTNTTFLKCNRLSEDLLEDLMVFNADFKLRTRQRLNKNTRRLLYSAVSGLCFSILFCGKRKRCGSVILQDGITAIRNILYPSYKEELVPVR